MRTKPFDLEAFKAGAPAVTRLKKQPVRYLGLLEGVKSYPLIAAINTGEGETLSQYTESGRDRNDYVEDDLDILMVVESRDYWANLYKDLAGTIYSGPNYSSRAEALAVAPEFTDSDYLATILLYSEEVTRG